MLEFKTKLSSVKLDENITISRKGKNPLELEYEKRFIDYLQPKENYLYLIIGVYKSAYYVSTCDHCGCAFSVNGDYAEVQCNYFCSDDCASMECVW